MMLSIRSSIGVEVHAQQRCLPASVGVGVDGYRSNTTVQSEAAREVS